ncbi:MAG: DNA glycosylase [Clostridia bacterium]
MNISQQTEYVKISGLTDFNLSHIFECGQCFRFVKQEDESFIGVAFEKVWHLYEKDGEIYISGTIEDFEQYMRAFLDLDRDYASIKKDFATDDFTKKAAEYGNGIRILKQDPWEALCSFIISQCNNIPRIMSIINTLCTTFGDKIEFQGTIYYTFPTYQKISTLTVEDLAPLRSGYRAKYIISVANALNSGEFDFKCLEDMDIKACRKEVTKLHGVGIKVADCFLLFGMGKLDAFPIDTWMKKAQAFYDGDMNPEKYGEYAGIYQQYIFYYARSLGI